MKHLERIANIAAILGVAVFLTVVIRGEFLRYSFKSGDSSQSVVGTTINLAGLRHSPQENTLILGISASCHFL